MDISVSHFYSWNLKFKYDPFRLEKTKNVQTYNQTELIFSDTKGDKL